jgi:membrane-bound serine protease (ClpP class)
VSSGIARAAADGAAAAILELNTPGGALDATSQITSALLTAPLPTIVWVAPSGSRAASAGTFITLAAALAYMAEGTNIGAATPVTSSGADIGGDLGRKVKNDAIANITAIAQARHRNVDWAASTVDKAVSTPAAEAVAIGAVDGIANTIDQVLRQSTGRTIVVGGQEVTLDLAGAEVRELSMNPFQSFLHLLSDPNIAFLLFTIGTLALVFEIFNPNLVTGVIGAISLLLAFIGFGSLPLNIAGLLLIGLGIVLFILEASITSHGLLTIGGLVAFALGASALYTTPGPFGPEVAVALPLVAGMTVAAGLVMALVVYAASRSRALVGSPGTVGTIESPPGTLAEVRRPLDPVGSVYADGEEWTARSADGRSVARGTPVRVVAHEGLTVVVEPLDGAAAHPAGTGEASGN